MELLQTSAWALVVLAFFCLLQLLLLKRRKPAAHHDLTFPPGPPGSWPILGHLPFLGSGYPHQALAHLARASLGPIISLCLGSKRAVVVCNAHLAKEVLNTHDKSLANHPHFLYADHVFYGYDNSIAFSTYNPRWIMLRKLCTLELFTPKRLRALEQLRYEEVRCLLRSLREGSWGGTQPVDLGKCFSLMLCNSIGRVVHSKTLAEAGGHDYASMLKYQEKLMAPTIGDLVPWLKFSDVLPKLRMKAFHRRVDHIIETMISQRRKLVAQSKKVDESLPQDLLEVLLSREASNKHSTSSIDNDELLHINQIKGTIMDVLSAGIHTTAATLEWVMAELLRNPRCMQKLRAEIDAVIGTAPDRFITDEDIPGLPYLEQVIKEAFRLHPVLPLLVPHVASKAVKLDKYMLSKGTLVFVNVWAIGRDPDVWQNPEEFWPERFDGCNDQIDLKGQQYDLLPFGAGRRACPGMRLALSVLHVTLANLVQKFEWELPREQTYQELDMSEQIGFTSTRATPLLAIPKQRM